MGDFVRPDQGHGITPTGRSRHDEPPTRAMCSCGRAEVEQGCDLCAYCHREYDERQAEREDEERGYPDEDWYV